ncbi:MAG: PAS domain S-box protein [Gammaproteobacteria bacterium]
MRLSWQITLVTGAVALFTALTAAIVAHRAARADAVEHALSAAEARGRLLAQQLESRLETLRADVVALREGAAMAHLRALPRDLAAPDLALLADDFRARLRASPTYLQLRLLAPDGQELLRLERDASANIVEGSATRLQDKSRRPDFIAALALGDGGVHVSPIELDTEHGFAQHPARPVVRAAAPVRDAAGALLGIIVVNLDLGPFVARLARAPAPLFELTITDATGRCLIAPARFDAATVDTGCVAEATAPARPPGDDAIAGRGAAPFAVDAAAREIVRIPVIAGDDRRFGIVLAAKPASLNAMTSAVSGAIVPSAATILGAAVFIGWLLSRSVTRPLERMSRALAGFDGRGHLAAPDGGSTEVRHLGRAFEQMAREIDQRTAQLERDERRFRALVEHSPVGTLVVDGDGRIRLTNSRAQGMFGYAAGTLQGMSVDVLVPPRHRDAHPALRRAYSARPTPRPMGADRELYALRADGSEFPVEIALTPFRDDDGMHFVASVVDITERKAAAAFVETALREKEVLLREIYHRVKNNLQTLSALIALQQRRAPPGLPRELLRDSGARVHAMALAHELLHRADDVGEVDFAAYARELVRHITTVHAVDAGRIRLDCHGSVRLDVDRTIPLGLILNELVVNSLKHAFPDRRPGTIDVSIAHTDGRISLTVSDDGIGMRDDEPANGDTLGRTLVRSLADQLEADVTTAGPPGTAVTLSFAL